jgi:2-oxoglutarate ferredoxin oxidoreductase subunit beta
LRRWPKIENASAVIEARTHPEDGYLRAERMPHIWCAGCGIGVAMTAYIEAMKCLEASIPLEKQIVVSGIGCTGRAAGYMNVDSYHTTHGRAIPFATGMKIANPELEVSVFSGD